MHTAARSNGVEIPWGRRPGGLAAAGSAARAWLEEPGLLTDRLRACCGGVPGLVVITQAETELPRAEAALLNAGSRGALLREVELTCDGRPWVFAQTLVPAVTLSRQPWLATLGDTALGERLAALPDLERGELEFARLAAGMALYERALRGRDARPAALWARRSWFAIGGDRLLVHEVFLPEALG